MQTSQPAFDQRWESSIFGKGRHFNRYPFDAVIAFLFRHYGAAIKGKQPLKLLEVGCGSGNNVWATAREGIQTSGIDGSQSAIHMAQSLLREMDAKADLRVGCFTSLPWETNTFDIVVDRAALTCNRKHVIAESLDEIRRVLKPGGKFFSELFSIEHSGRPFGKPHGDGSYDGFTDGYFKDFTLTYFADSAAVDELYGSRFQMRSKRLILDEELVGDKENILALWRVIGEKT